MNRDSEMVNCCACPKVQSFKALHNAALSQQMPASLCGPTSNMWGTSTPVVHFSEAGQKQRDRQTCGMCRMHGVHHETQGRGPGGPPPAAYGKS